MKTRRPRRNGKKWEIQPFRIGLKSLFLLTLPPRISLSFLYLRFEILSRDRDGSNESCVGKSGVAVERMEGFFPFYVAWTLSPNRNGRRAEAMIPRWSN